MNKGSRSASEMVVFGVVQGVGFRPFVYRLAHRLGYKGWVKNIGFGVEIHLETEKKTGFRDFLRALRDNAPPLAQISDIRAKPASFKGLGSFKIEKSAQEESFVFISPDISVCENCSQEMMAPSDRRYLYPFINCTDCGPRYTIVRALPYDRKQTTMKDFTMCPACRKEYDDPLDRRYHAQPIACPLCGPQVRLLESGTRKEIEGGIRRAVSLIKQGKILAVKGLGGFHLVCDPLNRRAVQSLRKTKARKSKPLALMARSLSAVRKYARVGPEEKAALLSSRRPIVLLKKKKDLQGIAPHLDEIGFMLPYTPLHLLLLQDLELIVATSSNRKDAPIMKDEKEGIDDLCDYMLTHNRPIHMRADDSVIKIAGGRPLFLRRARGYVPYPQAVPKFLQSSGHILATGAELKDTISVYKNGYVITSQFLGDLDEYQNYSYFQETIRHLTKLFEVEPSLVVSDLHPDFHTTRYAQKKRIPHLQVQHHFAHGLAILLEHGHPLHEKVLGVSFDGYGYGSDGRAWGGEFLLMDYRGFERFGHFAYVPLPGGDLAARQPWRMALSYLRDAFGENIPSLPALGKVDARKIKGVLEMLKHRVNAPLTSSCGRLFDAVSFMAGVSPLEMEYEAEAPMRLEASAGRRSKGRYRFEILENRGDANEPGEGKTFTNYLLSFKKMIRAIASDCEKRIPVPRISAKFHRTLAEAIGEISEKARAQHGVRTVVLSGGVFLNKRLLLDAGEVLEEKGFSVLRSVNYSPNDESLSLGQIAYALRLRQDE